MTANRIFYLVIFFILNIQVPAVAAPIIIRDGQGEYPVSPGIEILEDPSKKLGITDVTRPEIASRFFQHGRNLPQFGFTNSAYWVRFTIVNNDPSAKSFYLEHGYAPMDKIILYFPKGDGTYGESTAGDMVPFDKRDVKYRNSVFMLDVAPSSRAVFYMRFESTSSMNISLTLWKKDLFTEDSNRKEIFFGLFYGIMLVMILYNLMVFFSVRDIAYLYYIFYTLGATLFYATIHGHSFEYLWKNLWWANLCLPLFITVSNALAIQFNRSFLDTRRILPRYDVLLRIMIVISLAASVMTFFVKYSTAIQTATLLTIVTPCLLITSGIIVLVRGNRAARFYNLAWSLFLVGTIVQSLRAFGVLTDNFFTVYSQQIGAVFEVTLLSLALADRINMMKKERERSQSEIINIQRNYSESLERTVQERTMELEIERNKLQAKNRIMEHEIALARQIQDKLIPGDNPAPFISSLYRPMEQVGGDFYDFIRIGESSNVGIFLSDVSGHGVPAAFITSMIKTIILQAGSRVDDPADLLHYMNEVLQSQTAGNFVTSFYGIYDPLKRTLLYSNAGHNQPFIITSESVIQLQGGRNTAIAMLPNNMLARANKKYTNYSEVLPAGSKLLLYTDGLTETRPVDADIFFEYANMENVFLSNHKLACSSFLVKLLEELIAFRKSEHFDDDICLICVDVV